MNRSNGTKNSNDAKELAATYRSISVFRNVGIGLFAGGIWAGYSDWNEYSGLAVTGVAVGAVLIWMTKKMKKDVDENGVAKKPSFFADEKQGSPVLNRLSSANAADEIMDLGLPKNIELQVYNGYILLVRKWFAWSHLFMLFVLLSGLGVGWFVFSNYTGDINGLSESLIQLLPWLFLLFNIAFIYPVLAKVVNKTHIFVSKDAIEIKHLPLPWPGNKRIEKRNIKQLYGKEEIRNHNRGVHISYEVHIISTDDRDLTLLKGLKTSSQALYLEQEIEKYLGIKNRKVRGEIGAEYNGFL